MRQSSSERARMRRIRGHYRRVIVVAVLIALIIGCIGGILLDRLVLNRYDIPFLADLQKRIGGGSATPSASVTPAPTDAVLELNEVTATPEPSPEATQEPEETPEPTATVEPTATPMPEPTDLAVVPFGESYTFDTQVKSDGQARIVADDADYETISLTATMVNYMLPKDFADKYANQYRLSGTEAGAGFELILNDYTGELTIIPEDVIKLALESESGDVELGFRLMDAEINGNYGVKIDTNTPKVLYKRYQYTNVGEPMKYLVVSCYNDGVEGRILFELESDVPPETNPTVVYSTLQKGAKGDDVQALQNQLIDLGYLEGKADGDFGSKTEQAIKDAQKNFGMQETGVADAAFQQRLFAEPEKQEGESEASTATGDQE